MELITKNRFCIKMEFRVSKEESFSSGIYKITNNVNNKIYIGSTKNFRVRYLGHRNSLKNGTHHSKRFQGFVNEFGLECLVFEKYLLTNADFLLSEEQKAMDFYECYKQENGYNISPIAGKTLNNNPSLETRKLLSIVKMGSKNGMSKMNDETVLSIRKEYHTKTNQELCLKYGLGKKSIFNIISGNTWSHLPLQDYIGRPIALYTPKGNNHYNSSFTNFDIEDIRNLAKNETVNYIASLYNRPVETIRSIIKRHTWKHI